MTTLAQDNFTRANQSGFGTASDGTNTWGSPVNGSATAAIASNRGVFGNLNNDTQMLCGSHSGTTDINMLVKLSTSNVNNVAGILWRYSSASGGNGYRCGFFSGNQFVVDKYTNGSRSNLVDNSITSYSANSDLWIRLIHTAGGTLQIRWWADGNSEPSNFNSPFVNQSETSFSSGNFGVSVAIFSGNTVSYGSFTVTDNQSTTTSTRTITPVTAALYSTLTRNVTASAALYASLSRVVTPATAALYATLTRTITPATAALYGTGTRPITASAALFASLSRNAPATAALYATLTRIVAPVTTALSAIATRQILIAAALFAVNTRAIPSSGALYATLARNVSADTSLYSTLTRTITATAALDGLPLAVIPNATLLVRSGEATAQITSGEATAVIRSGEATSILRS